MANTLALGASAERLAGSSPAFRTKIMRSKDILDPSNYVFRT